MAFFINGHQYSDTRGDSIKEAAQRLFVDHETIHNEPGAGTYARDDVQQAIERELDKLKYANNSRW